MGYINPGQTEIDVTIPYTLFDQFKTYPQVDGYHTQHTQYLHFTCQKFTAQAHVITMYIIKADWYHTDTVVLFILTNW